MVGAIRMFPLTQVVAIVNMPLSSVGAQAAQALDSLRVEPGSQDSGYPYFSVISLADWNSAVWSCLTFSVVQGVTQEVGPNGCPRLQLFQDRCRGDKRCRIGCDALREEQEKSTPAK